MKVKVFSHKEWSEKYQDDAYRAVFGVDPPEGLKHSLFDHALLIFEGDSDAILYATIKIFSKNSGFLEFGGAYPKYKNSLKVRPAFKYMLECIKDGGIENVVFSTQNTNVSMQKLGLSLGFIPMGVSFGNDGLLIEYSLKLT